MKSSPFNARSPLACHGPRKCVAISRAGADLVLRTAQQNGITQRMLFEELLADPELLTGVARRAASRLARQTGDNAAADPERPETGTIPEN